MTADADERTALYRLFAADDTLLYVGISRSFGVRWEQHAAIQPWWPEVHRQTVEWFPSREDAAEAEIAAIQAEHPRFNVVHAVKPPGRTPTLVPRQPHRPIPIADELDKRIEHARTEMDTDRAELMAGIREALAAGRTPSRIGRYAHWSRDQIVKIRDKEQGSTT